MFRGPPPSVARGARGHPVGGGSAAGEAGEAQREFGQVLLRGAEGALDFGLGMLFGLVWFGGCVC